jgi:hypothetical protein
MAKPWYARIATMTAFGPKKYYSTALSAPSLVLIGLIALQTVLLVKSVGGWSGL